MRSPHSPPLPKPGAQGHTLIPVEPTGGPRPLPEGAGQDLQQAMAVPPGKPRPPLPPAEDDGEELTALADLFDAGVLTLDGDGLEGLLAQRVGEATTLDTPPQRYFARLPADRTVVSDEDSLSVTVQGRGFIDTTDLTIDTEAGTATNVYTHTTTTPQGQTKVDRVETVRTLDDDGWVVTVSASNARGQTLELTYEVDLDDRQVVVTTDQGTETISFDSLDSLPEELGLVGFFGRMVPLDTILG